MVGTPLASFFNERFIEFRLIFDPFLLFFAGAKIKGVRWLNKQSNVNAVPEESKSKVLHKEMSKGMGDSLDASDIIGAAPKPSPKAKKSLGSLDVQDIVKPRKVANMFKSLDAVPIKDKLGEDVVKKPTPIDLSIFKDE